MELYLNWV